MDRRSGRHAVFLAVTLALSSCTCSISRASLTIDVRAASGAGDVVVLDTKDVVVTGAASGDQVLFDVYAVIHDSNDNVTNDQGLLFAYGSFLSQNPTGGGSVRGNLV